MTGAAGSASGLWSELAPETDPDTLQGDADAGFALHDPRFSA
jgi:hypothetical protein